MMKLLSALLISSAVLVGCSSSGDPGDVEKAAQAAQAAPKTADQLPADMPPQAKQQAEAAMQQGQAMAQQMNAQGEAMKKAQAAGQGK
jgi:PBP1b-binding outer membrane lipoprotein LpoB